HRALDQCKVLHNFAHLFQGNLWNWHAGDFPSIGKYQLPEGHQEFTFVGKLDLSEPFILIGSRSLENSKNMRLNVGRQCREIMLQESTGKCPVVARKVLPTLPLASGAVLDYGKDSTDGHG